MFELGTQRQCDGHYVINRSGVSAAVTIQCSKRIGTDYGFGSSGEPDPVDHVGIKLIGIQSGKVIVDDNPLAQSFIYWLLQSFVEVRLCAENQCEAVRGIILEVHQHLEIPEDSRTEVLCFIKDQYERLPLLFIQVVDLFLYGLEHNGLSAADIQSEGVADLPVELCNGNGCQTEIHDLVEVLIQFFSEASDTVRLSHSGGGCKYADGPDVYEIPQPVQECTVVLCCRM